MQADIISRNDLAVIATALLAGFLVALWNPSVLLLVALAAGLWFSLERLDLAVLLFLTYLPLQVALNLSAGFDVASGRVLVLFLFFVWLGRSLKEKRLEIAFSPQTFLLAAFLLLALLSSFQGFAADRALRKLLVLFSVCPLYLILTSFSGQRNFLLRAVRFLLWGGLLVALLGLLQFGAQFAVGIDPLFALFSQVLAPVFLGSTFATEVVANPSWLVNVGGVTLLRAFSLFPDPHIFSFYLGLLLPLSFTLLLSPRADLEKAGWEGGRFFLLVSFLFLAGAEFCTFSRGGYVGMAASFAVMLLLCWRHFSLPQRGMLISLVLGASLWFGQMNNSVKARLLSSFDLFEGSNAERLKNWNEGWTMFADHPWSGVGIGNYSFHLDPTLPYRAPVYAHNLYLDLGAEMGMLALLSWVLLIAVTLWQLYRASLRTKNRALSFLAIGLIGALVWYSVHSFFDTSLFAPNILMALVAILSLSVLLIRRVKEEG